MKLLCCLFLLSAHLFGANNTFLDYQNYNHGYCPDCNCYPCKCRQEAPSAEQASPCAPCEKPNPCSPPATSTCTECGINICYLGAGIAGLCAAAAIIIGNGNGHSH